jgi:DNA-binding winged helix-turn-helix (wHTH) protein/tetratricopeptide (TPR) repeat protein
MATIDAWHASMIFRFDSCVLDAERRELRRDGLLYPLEPQVFDLIEFLIRNRERVVSKDDLVTAIWKGRTISDAALDTRISMARHAIGDSGSEQRLIRTLRTKGFRFIGAVHEEAQQNPTASAFDNIAPTHKLAWSVIGTPILAVRPFLNVTEDSGRQHLMDALAEEIIIELTNFGWLTVKILRNPLVGQPNAAKRSASKSGVQYLLEGTLREASNRLRLNVVLTEAFTGRQIWAGRYESTQANTFGDIAGQLTSTVANQAYAAECARALLTSRGSLTAWQYIIRALRLISTRKRAQIDAAEKLLGRATATDPSSAAVYSLQSFISTLRVHLGWQSRSKMAPALRTAEKALLLNPDEAWAHLALGYALTHTRPDEATEPLEAALRLDPNQATAHYLIALASAFSGDSEKAFRHADMAEHLSARGLLARGNVAAHDNVRATACIVSGQYREGIGFARKVIAQCPQQTPALRALIVNAAWAGEREQAKSAFKTLQRFAPTTPEWFDEFATVWKHREHYQRYVEAFRLTSLD